MRIFPILVSIAVAIAIYFFVMERDLLKSFSADEETEMAMVEETIERSDAVSVVAQHSIAQDVQSGIILRGRTEAARRVDVRAQTSGLVVSEPLRKGAAVEEGQLLCSLDPGIRSAQLAEAKARLADAEVSAANAADLAARGFGPETAVVSREAGLQSAQAGVLQIEQEISRLEIRAPFAGILETDSAELGSLMQPGGLCATIIDLNTVKLVGFATEIDINKIELGAFAGADLVSGKRVLGTVTFLSRSSDPVTRTFRVEITVDNADLSIRDGETAEIGIALEGEKGHLLPQHVLTLDMDGTLGVRISDNGFARFMPVTVLRDSADGIWLAGLPDTVDVITVGLEFTIDGSKINATVEGSE
ncbi:MAG: efflux RND transporter periplasmic adaptor subunit [Rhodobacteraceae bacterium]|nr:efflux RND transporter periplasmic adaptor subunit [Paracoccaceae bacterium]